MKNSSPPLEYLGRKYFSAQPHALAAICIENIEQLYELNF
jgi:hypothetical protein